MENEEMKQNETSSFNIQHSTFILPLKARSHPTHKEVRPAYHSLVLGVVQRHGVADAGETITAKWNECGCKLS